MSDDSEEEEEEEEEEIKRDEGPNFNEFARFQQYGNYYRPGSFFYDDPQINYPNPNYNASVNYNGYQNYSNY